MKLQTLIQLTADLPAPSARRVLQAVMARQGSILDTVREEPESLAEFTKRAATAFEKDMQPVVGAVADALHAGDLDALRGLRALLPTLLREVNHHPALLDLLAHQLGKRFLDGLNIPPGEAA